MIYLNPYLIFDGQAETAFHFYRDIFGGEFENFTRYKDAPADQQGANEQQMTAEQGNLIMHVQLPMAEGNTLMGCDRHPFFPMNVERNDATYICVNTDDVERAGWLFGRVAEGGKVMMPFAKTFWNSHYGMCVDKFGVGWMLNVDPQEVDGAS